MGLSIENLLQNSKVTVIMGNSKSGKNTFALYAIKSILQEDCLVLSSLESGMYKRKISIAQRNFSDFKFIGQDLDYFLLKDNYINLKRAYSYDFLEEEFKKVISETESKIIYVNRYEEFFEHQDRHDIEPLFKAILQFARENDKKVIFAISSSAYHFDFIYPMLEDFADLILSIKEKTLSKRIVDIKYSIETTDEYSFKFYSKGKDLFLHSYNEEEDSKLKSDKNEYIADINRKNKNEKDKTHILIISNNKDILSLHNYLFSAPNSESYEISIVNNDPFKALKKALDNPDVIIYNPSDDTLELEICKTIKENKLNSRVLYIVHKNFVRTSDKSKAFEAGCHELFSEKFSFEEYLLSLKKSFKSGFYGRRFKGLEANAKAYNNRKVFEKEVKEYLRRRVVFSMFTYTYGNDEIDLIKELDDFMRDYDRAFVDEKRRRVTYLAVNTRKFLGEAIGNRLKSIDSTIEYKGAKDAPSFIKK